MFWIIWSALWAFLGLFFGILAGDWVIATCGVGQLGCFSWFTYHYLTRTDSKV